MKTTKNLALLFTLTLVLLCTVCASAATLNDFTSDGCSLFPDGRFKDRGLWCDCCLNHDIAYWQGGTKEDRKRADEQLRDCVLERTDSKALSVLMYDGVRAGGHPAFPTWYRWGYGWKYGKGYVALTEPEKQLINERLGTYYVKHPAGYCKERHGDADQR